MNIVKLHQLIDQWAAEERDNKELIEGQSVTSEEVPTVEVPVRVLPEGKRVVTTKSSGDRVYLIDEVKKTRQWVTSPEMLNSVGFEFGDVTEVPDDELVRYSMGAALYKLSS